MRWMVLLVMALLGCCASGCQCIAESDQRIELPSDIVRLPWIVARDGSSVLLSDGSRYQIAGTARPAAPEVLDGFWGRGASRALACRVSPIDAQRAEIRMLHPPRQFRELAPLPIFVLLPPPDVGPLFYLGVRRLPPYESDLAAKRRGEGMWRDPARPVYE